MDTPKAPAKTGDCGCDQRPVDGALSTSRKGFLGWAGKALIALTAVTGGLVKFAPTAWAVTCNFGYNQTIFPQCQTSCIGSCVSWDKSSCCPTDQQNGVWACEGNPPQLRNFKVVASCSGGNGYYCGVYC